MIINNSQLIELFGTNANKEQYAKTRKVNNTAKENILNRLKEQYKIVKDLGRGKYEIDCKFNGTCNIPNSKIQHEIYGCLIPSILLSVKRHHDNAKVFCLSLTGIYGMYNMIHKDNYTNMKDRPFVTAELLDLDYNNTIDYFSVVHKSLKYYMESTLELLSNLKLIKVNELPYIKEYSESIEINKFKKHLKFRRATKEEEQKHKDLLALLDDKHSIMEEKERYYSKKSKNYIEDYTESLHSMGIDFFYDCYEVICLNKKNIEEILNFYDLSIFDSLLFSRNFSESFINLTIENAKTRVLKNKKVESFVNKYIDDFTKLTKNTLDGDCDTINIPFVKQCL